MEGREEGAGEAGRRGREGKEGKEEGREGKTGGGRKLWGALLSEALFSWLNDDFTTPSFISKSSLQEGQCQDSRNGCQRLCYQRELAGCQL